MSSVFDDAREVIALLDDKIHAKSDVRSLDSALRKRAASLASRGLEEEVRPEHGEVLVIRRDTSLLGFPIESVIEVRRVQVVPLPHATPTVQAMFHIRGKAHCLVDLHTMLTNQQGQETNEIGEAFVLVVNLGPGPLGVRIDEALGPRVVYVDECEEPLQERSQDFVSVVTRDLLTVLDIPKLVARPELSLSVSL